MENASKALLMAAGVLLGIMLLSLAVYLIVTFGSQSAEMHKQIEIDRLNQFNTQFTSYEGKQCTIYDVITVANLATENNKYYELNKMSGNATGNDMYIQVILKRTGFSDINHLEYGANDDTTSITSANNIIISDETNRIQSSDEYLPIYSCTVDISTTTNRVYKVIFSE